MFQPGPNDALSQNLMKLRFLVAEKNMDRQTDTSKQDSCIDILAALLRRTPEICKSKTKFNNFLMLEKTRD